MEALGALRLGAQAKSPGFSWDEACSCCAARGVNEGEVWASIGRLMVSGYLHAEGPTLHSCGCARRRTTTTLVSCGRRCLGAVLETGRPLEPGVLNPLSGAECDYVGRFSCFFLFSLVLCVFGVLSLRCCSPQQGGVEDRIAIPCVSHPF